MADLSQAAQTVFWEFNRAASGKPDDWHYLPAIAAALEALADQVTPENYDRATDDRGWNDGSEDRNAEIREQILAIAAELRGSDS